MSRDEEYATLVTEVADLAGDVTALEKEWNAFQREYTEKQQREESGFSQARSQAYTSLRTFHEHMCKKLASIKHSLNTKVSEKKLSRDKRHAACIRDSFAGLSKRCEEIRETREALVVRAKTISQQVAATYARAENAHRQNSALCEKLSDQETKTKKEAADSQSAIEALVEDLERIREMTEQGHGAAQWANEMSDELINSLSADMAYPE